MVDGYGYGLVDSQHKLRATKPKLYVSYRTYWGSETRYIVIVRDFKPSEPKC